MRARRGSGWTPLVTRLFSATMPACGGSTEVSGDCPELSDAPSPGSTTIQIVNRRHAPVYIRTGAASGWEFEKPHRFQAPPTNAPPGPRGRS
jgi:hypothetical protein